MLNHRELEFVENLIDKMKDTEGGIKDGIKDGSYQFCEEFLKVYLEKAVTVPFPNLRAPMKAREE